MRLHEYQAKSLFARFDIPVLNGELANTPEAARSAALRLKPPVVINAQVQANERVFRIADSLAEAEQISRDLLQTHVDGFAVNNLLIEPKVSAVKEYALTIEFDRSKCQIVASASAVSNRLNRSETIDPLVGIHVYQARSLASGIDLPSEHWAQFVTLVLNLYRCYVQTDATRVVIMPLALTSSGDLTVLGGKLDIDDNALYRQSELAEMRDVLADEELPSRIVYDRVRVMRLPGDITCIANGAGLAMATADAVASHNPSFSPGAVIEIDGEPNLERMQAALRFSPTNARGIIFNLFGDRLSAMTVVDNLQRLFSIALPKVPCTIRLAGQDAAVACAIWSARFPDTPGVSTLAEAVEALNHHLAVT